MRNIMRPRSFFISALIAAILFGVLNLAVAVLGNNTIPRQIARRIEQTPGLNCLALGNSLMQAGFDAAIFQAACRSRRGNVIALNAGLGSSYPVEHLLLLRRAFQKRAGLDCVMYGFFDFQLMQPPQTSLHELIGNRAMLYYFEPDVAARYYQWPPGDRLAFHITRFFPAIEERGAVWAKVEMLRRRFSGLGMPAQQNNQFGRTQDFALLEADSPAQFARECDQAVAARRELSQPVLDMIRLTREHGARMVMIEMPMSPTHIERYYSTPSWQHYRAYLKELLAAHGADLVSAGDWVPEDRLFADHLHLSPEGSIVFSRRLALVVGQVSDLPGPARAQAGDLRHTL